MTRGDSSSQIGLDIQLNEVLIVVGGVSSPVGKNQPRNTEIGDVCNNSAATSGDIAKWMSLGDSACQIGLETRSNGVLTVVGGASSGN